MSLRVSEGWVRSSRTGVRGCHVLPCGCWEPKSGPACAGSALTPKTSFQPDIDNVGFCYVSGDRCGKDGPRHPLPTLTAAFLGLRH